MKNIISGPLPLDLSGQVVFQRMHSYFVQLQSFNRLVFLPLSPEHELRESLLYSSEVCGILEHPAAVPLLLWQCAAAFPPFFCMAFESLPMKREHEAPTASFFYIICIYALS